MELVTSSALHLRSSGLEKDQILAVFICRQFVMWLPEASMSVATIQAQQVICSLYVMSQR